MSKRQYDSDAKTGMLPIVVPQSFPAIDGALVARRRAVFSSSFRGLTSHHATHAPQQFANQHDPRRYIDDYSLRLIDDLINRPVDPLFMDARLHRQHIGFFSKWFTRIIVFAVCAAVGAVGFQFVRKLHTDPRKAIRASLAAELSNQTNRFDTLVKDVTKLRDSIDRALPRVTQALNNEHATMDDMANGTRAVQGPGITLTLANPIASLDASASSLPREQKTTRLRLLTDHDIQAFVSILWQSGAEAIAINGHRLGVQTSIRTAGQTVLVGVNQTQSPYVIEAIGNSRFLRESIVQQKNKDWYKNLTNAGVTVQTSMTRSLTLSPAGTGDINFAQSIKKEE